MPANLNALIRYKQIDKCLRNKYVKCTIKRMREMCSAQLAEHRGIYKKVSERSIRDDIRIMRGSSLGFNAPIIVENGVYSYSKENFSIFDTAIDDMELLKKVMNLLIAEKDNISSPRLSSLLRDLSYKTGITYIDETPIVSNSGISENINIEDVSCYSENFAPSSNIFFDELDSVSNEEDKTLFSWKDVFEIIR